MKVVVDMNLSPEWVRSLSQHGVEAASGFFPLAADTAKRLVDLRRVTFPAMP